VLGGEGGCSIIFLQYALKNILQSNESMVAVMIAYIRQSIRNLSVIDYQGNDAGASNEKEDGDAASENKSKAGQGSNDEKSSDARLVSFLTGLLLTSASDSQSQPTVKLIVQLCQAWSVGLQSASAPWRMICMMTISSIMGLLPKTAKISLNDFSPISNFFERMESNVVRRIWAERAAAPIFSRYLQSMVELLNVMNRFPSLQNEIPSKSERVDAATPLPLQFGVEEKDTIFFESKQSWEGCEGWICSDKSWEIWTGAVEYFQVEWAPPSRSAVRSLMDAGEGPPMLREGCSVLRGVDWDEDSFGDDDGRKVFEAKKIKREEAKKEQEDQDPVSSSPQDDSSDKQSIIDDAAIGDDDPTTDTPVVESSSKKKKKIPLPKLPVGRVISIEPWNGIPGVARRVRWDVTGKEGIYRYGGDGGRYDIVHIEVNEKGTRVTKRHPHSETAEQCSARHGFGTRKVYNIILRLRMTEYRAEEVDGELEHSCEGIIEWPDFGAGIAATCRFHEDGAVSVTEGKLIYGPKDSGWEGRFGGPSYVPGTTIVLSPTNHVSSPSLKEDGLSEKISNDSCQFEELLGSTSFTVNHLRNRENGEKIRVACEMRLVRGKEVNPKMGAEKSSILPPISFDRDYHSSSLQISRDGRTVTCTSAEGRSSAFLSTGFSKGIHYFEVKIEQADVGSVFIGVAEKPKAGTSSGGSLESRPRLKGWYGLGFVNFRATYNEGSERVYGSHCHAGDTIGVLLDCDAGRLSYFFDGVKYGEHILNDLGCAFENISPFGFNADGCGGGGASQGAPSGEGGRGSRHPANGSVRPKSLWPVIGLRHLCDRVTISKKWMTSYGIEGSTMLRNAIRVDEVLRSYQYDNCESKKQHKSHELAAKEGYSIPDWFIKESFTELNIWVEGKMVRTTTRAAGPADYSTFGLHIDVDTTPLECAAACASLGLECVLLPGDIVSVKRSAGRILELAEEAEVLGAFQGKLWYKLVSQKSEGGSLTEGGGRAWFWDESEVVDRGLQLKNPSLANKIALSPLNRFKCSTKGGIRVTYSSGAVLRSDVEINEEISSNIGIIPEGTIIPCRDIIERRVNSCGVVRFHVLYEPVGTGWISLYIRGGDEERVLEILETALDVAVENKDVDEMIVKTCSSPYQSAQIWLKEYTKLIATESKETSKIFMVEKFEEFQALLAKGVIEGLSPLESDTILCDIVTSISDHSPGGNTLNCPYRFLCPVLFHALKAHNYLHEEDLIADFNVCESSSAHESASSRVAKVSCSFPPMRALLCRIAMLRALNRRAIYALPLYSLRPPQEDSAVLGGCSGFGASVERLGKTEQKLSGWIQAPSIGKRLRVLKTLFFTSVKRSLFDGITEATTTATSLSQDEYELPRDIRTVRVNRLKARKGMNSSDRIIRRKNSVFGQLQTELRGWTGAALRRGYVAKGHGGQKRAFKVKLIGEGVNDYSGPYREIFTDAISDVNETGSLDASTLGILDPSPNGSVGVGESRNLKIFASCVSSEYGEFLTDASIMEEERLIRNHFSSHLVPRNERVRDLEDSLSFLGKLVSTAVRHGIPVDLSLPLGTVWKRLSEEDVNDLETFQEIDLLTFNRLQISKGSLADDNSTTEFLACQQHFFNAFADGLSSVLPVEVFSIFTAFELRDYFCGNQEIDVELLRSVVDYEGYDGDEEVIQYFWEVLREFTTEEKKLFLQFVWARSRLPLKASDFEAPFKIQKDTKSASYEALPSASTCFFSLSLPEYTSREMLRKKLLFAIKNVKTMETDFSTNDVEVEEGWRGL